LLGNMPICHFEHFQRYQDRWPTLISYAHLSVRQAFDSVLSNLGRADFDRERALMAKVSTAHAASASSVVDYGLSLFDRDRSKSAESLPDAFHASDASFCSYLNVDPRDARVSYRQFPGPAVDGPSQSIECIFEQTFTSNS